VPLTLLISQSRWTPSINSSDNPHSDEEAKRRSKSQFKGGKRKNPACKLHPLFWPSWCMRQLLSSPSLSICRLSKERPVVFPSSEFAGIRHIRGPEASYCKGGWFRLSLPVSHLSICICLPRKSSRFSGAATSNSASLLPSL
jgi:hypothetical protein